MKEVEEGKYYMVAYKDNKYLMKANPYTIAPGKKEILSPCIFLNKNIFSKSGSFRFNGDFVTYPLSYCKIIREASNEEIIWFEKCIELDTFISFEEVIVPEIFDILKKLNL